MREAYATWLEALGKSDKYKNSKPDWEWIENAEEAEKVRRLSIDPLPNTLPLPSAPLTQDLPN